MSQPVVQQQSIPNLPPGVPQPQGNQQVIIYNIAVPPPAPPSKKKPVTFGKKYIPGLTVLIVRWALCGLLWASWVIFIGGTSYAQQQCNQGMLNNANPFGGSYGDYGAPAAEAVLRFASPNIDSSACTNYFGKLWWAVWLEFFAIVIYTISNATYLRKLTANKFDGASVTCLYLFLMNTIQLFFIVDQFQTAAYLLKNRTFAGLDQKIWYNASATITAGAILCIIFNAAYMISMTYRDPTASHSNNQFTNPKDLPRPVFHGSTPPGEGDAVYDAAGVIPNQPLHVQTADEGLASRRPGAAAPGTSAVI